MTIQLLAMASRTWDDGQKESETMLLEYPDKFTVENCYDIEMTMMEMQAEKDRPGLKCKLFLRYESLPISTQ